MYSDRLLDHFRNPRNAGELPLPALMVEAENPACGDILRLWVEWVDGRAARVAYKVRGCTASIAAGSALTELMTAKTKQELSAIDADSIEREVGGLPPTSKHAAALCADALGRMLKLLPS